MNLEHLQQRIDQQQADQAAKAAREKQRLIHEYTTLLLTESRTKKQDDELIELMQRLDKNTDQAADDLNALLTAERLKKEISDKPNRQKTFHDAAARRRQAEANLKQAESDLRTAAGELMQADFAVQKSDQASIELEQLQTDHADLF